jgi:hypothetical protein
MLFYDHIGDSRAQLLCGRIIFAGQLFFTKPEYITKIN